MKLSSLRLTNAAIYDGNGFDSGRIITISNNIGIDTYDSRNALPLTADSGSQAYTLDSNLWFIYDGANWYSTTLTRTAPTATQLLGAEKSVNRNTLLSKDQNGIVIQLIATDADSNPLQYSLESDGNLRNLATFTQDSSVFTFTAVDSSVISVDSSQVTFKVSDGISFATIKEKINFSYYNDSNNWLGGFHQLNMNRGPDHNANDELGNSIAMGPDGDWLVTYYVRRATNMFIAPGGLLTWKINDSTGHADLIHNMWTTTNTTWGFGGDFSVSDDGLKMVATETSFDHTETNVGRFWYFDRDSTGGEWIKRQELRGTIAGKYIPGSITINSGPFDYMIGTSPDQDSGDLSVYTRSGTTWTKQREISSPDKTSSFRGMNKLGTKGLFHGDSVGYLHGDDDWTEPPGWFAARTKEYQVWERNPSSETWTFHSRIPIPPEIIKRSLDYNEITSYGNEIVIDSDWNTICIGADRYQTDDYYNRNGLSGNDSENGAIFVFKYDGADSWELAERIDGYENLPTDFGSIRLGQTMSLSRDGNTLFSTEAFDSDYGEAGTYMREGVLVLNRRGNSFEKINNLSRTPTGRDAGTTISFGQGIKTTRDGKIVAIGARYVDSDQTYGGTGTQVNRGDIHLFRPHAYDTANINLNVSNSGNVSYLFAGKHRVNNSVKYQQEDGFADNPTIYVNTGDIVKFNVDAPGHPIWIKTNQSTGTGNGVPDVVNNGTEDGTITWNPKFAATYYYNCQHHSAMRGSIVVLDQNKFRGQIS